MATTCPLGSHCVADVNFPLFLKIGVVAAIIFWMVWHVTELEERVRDHEERDAEWKRMKNPFDMV